VGVFFTFIICLEGVGARVLAPARWVGGRVRGILLRGDTLLGSVGLELLAVAVLGRTLKMPVGIPP